MTVLADPRGLLPFEREHSVVICHATVRVVTEAEDPEPSPSDELAAALADRLATSPTVMSNSDALAGFDRVIWLDDDDGTGSPSDAVASRHADRLIHVHLRDPRPSASAGAQLFSCGFRRVNMRAVAECLVT